MNNSALKKIVCLLEHFDRAGVCYAHWKSNNRLGDSLRGLTDLDLLIAPGQATLAKSVLEGEDFRYFPAVSWRRHKAIVDYYGFDEETGRLVHVHLHEQLWIGKKFVKEYHLPWEKALLETRIMAPGKNIYIPDSRLELLLLLLRTAARLPVPLRPLFDRILMRRSYSKISSEVDWLIARPDEKVALPESYLDPGAQHAVEYFLKTRDMASFIVMNRALKTWLKLFGSMSEGRASVKDFFRKARVALARFLRSTGPALYKRTPASSGRVIAVIGVDGSGKSTITTQLVLWLKEMTDVWPVYMGTGDGKNSLFLEPFKAAFRVYKRTKGSYRLFSGMEKQKKPSFLKFIWAFSVVCERLVRLRMIRKARLCGIVVVADRYPQCQQSDYLDGPLMSSWSNSGAALMRRLSKWEHSVYASAQQGASAPDMVLRLNIDVETALRRKPGKKEDIDKRVRAVSALTFPASTKIVDLSAQEKFEEVLLRCKKAIWSAL